MSLRTRLTLLFASLAALSVLVAALVGYQSTADRLQREIDQTLRVGVSRAVGADFDGRICLRGTLASNGRRFDGRRGADLPGARLQCLDGNGAPVGATIPGEESDTESLPVDAIDRELARRRVGEPLVVGPVDGPGEAGSSRPQRPTRGLRGALDDEASAGLVRLRTVEVNGTSLRVATAAIRGGGAVMISRDLDESDRVLSGLRKRFALIGVVVVGVAAAFGSFVAGAFARPIRALTGVTESIASEGALSPDGQIGDQITGRRDEIGRLGASFASMLSSLRSSRNQQRQLAQDAGHELRTPLTSLRTNVDVLIKYPDLAPDKRLAVLQEMDAELRELSALTDELLVLATDATPDDPEGEVELLELTKRAIDRLERRSNRAVRLAGTPSVVVGRRIQLSRAIDNVLANAAKFDSSTQPIEVTVSDGEVMVRDHGPGFVAVDLGRVFDRFYRSDAARQLPGTGLGLSIAAEAAKAHGGRALASNHPDGGALVALRFRSLEAVPD